MYCAESVKRDDIYKICILLSDKHTCLTSASQLVPKLVMGPESLYCSKGRKISKSHRDLDLSLTMPNIQLFRVIFIYYDVFKFHVP